MKFIQTCLFLLLSHWCFGQSSISLSGSWTVKLDSIKNGANNSDFNHLHPQKINLPGTLDDAQLGQKTNGSDYGILSRKYKYIGPAWYNRVITIPKSWNNKYISLKLERVMWESQVWVDGKQIGTEDDLSTPHLFELGKLKPGKHLLSIRVDNSMKYNIGDKGHAYGEYTQIRWNGILGEIVLIADSDIQLKELTTWPDTKSNALKIKFHANNLGSEKNGIFTYSIKDLQTGDFILKESEKTKLTTNIHQYEKEFRLNSSIKSWDEFNPNLYQFEVKWTSGQSSESVMTNFGFRTLTHSKSKILVNEKPIFLRGNIDCVHFPLTGYPAFTQGEWERIFKIYKAHGLNQVRFHSWCPPEAAFDAADKLGIYIQAEVVWIDWWMSVVRPERPEMTTEGLPKGLGKNESADRYVQAALNKIIREYGNHPSFSFLCIGNELGNSDFDVMQSWIKKLEETDNRRLYSVSTARKIMSVDEYMVTHNIPGVGNTYGLKESGTNYDFESNYSKATIPIIAHEVGQFPVYPLWSEIDKYTGVLEARNLKELQVIAQQNGIENDDKNFQKASGALQNILYKELIEALQRTPSCAGYHLLSMTDYSGQGEALIGWLDSFWDSKNTLSPQIFNQYSSEVVPLARFDSYVINNNDVFKAKIEVANFSQQNLTKNIHWKIVSQENSVLDEGTFNTELPQGKLSPIGEIRFETKNINNPQKLTLKVELKETNYKNEWDFWYYPTIQDINSTVIETNTLTPTLLKQIEEGASAIVYASNAGNELSTYPLNFMPLFWSNSFFPGQENKTLGYLINNSHPIFSYFPTDSHTNWQWAPISTGRAFVINNIKGLEPIIQPISDFHINDKLASLFECSIGKGKLLVCGHDLSNNTVSAKQLKYSILKYANSSNFNPTFKWDSKYALLMLGAKSTAITLPKPFENSYFYLECGKNLAKNESLVWDKSNDSLLFAMDGFDYKVKLDEVWKANNKSGWKGTEIDFDLKTPDGLIGNLCVFVENQKEELNGGKIIIENREYELKTDDNNWIKLLVMREDTNKGSINLRIVAPNGKQVSISKVVFVRN